MFEPEVVKYSLSNLWQRRARSLFTIVSIFIGIATIFIFVSFGWGLYDYIDELSSSSSADKVIIQPKGTGMIDTTFKLTDNDLDAVESVAGVYEASGLYLKAAEVTFRDKNTFVLLTAYDPNKPFILDSFGVGIDSGRTLREADDGKVLLGYNYKIADRIFSEPINLNDNVEINGKKLRVVGFLEEIGSPSDDSQIYVTNSYMQELYPDEELSYGWIIARVDVKNIDEIIEKITKELRNERGLEKGKEDFYVQSFEALIEGYSSALDIVIAFVILIALISVVVSAVNTANTMITSVLERVKEIGVIKSIGAKNSDVFGVFLFESGFLGFVAGVVGVIIGFAMSYTAGVILDNLGWGFLQPHFSIWIFIGCIAFATFTGAVSGVFPAIKASKINPVDALRYE